MQTYHNTFPDLLILGAFEPELAPLRDPLKCHKNIRIEAVGVGLIEASMNAYKIIANEIERTGRNFEVLWVGSVGKSPNVQYPLLSLIACDTVKLADYGIITGNCSIPEIMTTEISSPSRINEIVLNLHLASACSRFYTTLGITSNRDTAQQLAKFTGSSFESMELFAVASAANKQGINWSALSAITNSVGNPDEWKSNFREAARKTAAAVLELFTLSMDTPRR